MKELQDKIDSEVKFFMLGKMSDLENELDKLFNTPEIARANKETMNNLLDYGQSCIHHPSLTVGISIEDVKYKMRIK